MALKYIWKRARVFGYPYMPSIWMKSTIQIQKYSIRNDSTTRTNKISGRELIYHLASDPVSAQSEHWMHFIKKNQIHAIFSGACIASRFATMKVKTLIFHMLVNFEIEMCSKTQHPIKLKNTAAGIESEKGFWINLKKRTIEWILMFVFSEMKNYIVHTFIFLIICI